jgi:CHAT domain-containing protein/tetratricopeptide (TPR) repeat protein
LTVFYVLPTPCLAGTEPNNTEAPNLADIGNQITKAYSEGQFAEVAQKLEIAKGLLSETAPLPSKALFYVLLAFFQEKAGNPQQAAVNFSVARGLFEKCSCTQDEIQAFAVTLGQLLSDLRDRDKVSFLEKLRPILKDPFGKAPQALVTVLIAYAYNSLNNYLKAYDFGLEALRLANESGQLTSEVDASIVISLSLMGLGRISETDAPLHKVLPKTENDLKQKIRVLGALGAAYNAKGDRSLAVQNFQEGISLARSSGELFLLAGLRRDLGLMYLSIGKPQESVQEVSEALSYYVTTNDEINIALTERLIGHAYLGTRDFKEANEHASRAADIFNRHGFRTEEAQSLRIVGESLTGLDRVEEGLSMLDKAIDIQVAEKDLREAFTTFMLTNRILTQIGRIDLVRRNLTAGLEANATLFADKKVEAYIRSQLGDVNKSLGLHLEALVEYMKAFKLYEELSDKKSQILMLLSQADVFAELDDRSKRIELLGAAERMGTDLNDPADQVLILNRYALAWWNFGSTINALETYLEELEVAGRASREVKLLPLIGISELLGTSMGDYDGALRYLEEARNLAKDINDQKSESNILLAICEVYLRMGHFEDVVRIGRDALTLIRTLKVDKVGYETRALQLVGLGLGNQGMYDSAIESYQEWLQIALNSQSLSQVRDANSSLCWAYLKSGSYEKAITTCQTAIQQTETMRFRLVQELRAGFFKANLSPYDNLVEAFYQLYLAGGPEQGHFAEGALGYAELSKARTWMEQFSNSRLRFLQEEIPPDVRSEESSLLEEINISYPDYMKVLYGYKVPHENLLQKQNAWEAVSKKWTTFVEKLNKQYPRYAALRYPRPVRLGELQVRGEEVLVVYKTGVEWTYAWVIRKIDGENRIVKFTRLPVRTDVINRLAEGFLKPFRKVEYQGFQSKAASELFKSVLLPLIEGTEVKHLVIVPDGILNAVSFEALVTGQTLDEPRKPIFLGDQAFVSYYPSATILTINREAVPSITPPKDTLLAVGDPVYGPDDERHGKTLLSAASTRGQEQASSVVTRSGLIREEVEAGSSSFARLRNSGIEVAKINAAFGNRPGSRDLLIGFQATKSHVTLKDLTKYQYVHFAVHGILAYDVPYLKEPALVLGADPAKKEDAFLTLSEIYGLKLNADLVVLSACSTGLGQSIPGEGVIGLGRAFINAGSRAVLVSLWQVDDYSTALFMEKFYHLLAQGVNKLEALAKARQYIREKGYENPYFWAAFILIGD